MDKILEKQKNDNNNSKYYDKPANRWLREYLKRINENGHGNKVISDKHFAKKCGIKYSRICSIIGGKGPVYAEDIIVFSEKTGASINEILGIEKKKVPDNLKVKTSKSDITIITNILSQEVCNELSNHILKDELIPGQDEYLKFVEYLILEKDYLRNLLYNAEKSIYKLDSDINNNQLSKEELQLLDTHNKEYSNWKDAIRNNNNLKKRFNDLITDTKIRNDTRDFITRYIYNNLKET